MKLIILLLTQITYNIDGAEFQNVTLQYIGGTVYIKFDDIFKDGFNEI